VTGGSPSAGGTESGGTGGAAGSCSTVYYLDADDDTWGGATTACSPGSTGTWVTRGGDCDDENADVHPGQQDFSSEAYLPSDGGEASFDYNCSGDEEMQGMNRTSTATCASAAAGNGCDGTGYLPAEPARSGDGVDPYCGSTLYLTCQRVQGVCTGSEGTAAAATCR
jgi:hypothetical protein